MSIFNINDNAPTDDEPNVVLYTILGEQSELDPDGFPLTTSKKNAVAKKVYKNQTTYFIKIGLNGRIYNPMGMFSEGNHNKFLAKLGKSEWKFTKVNQKVFDMYLNFLKTKNIAWLNNAQREIY